MTHLKASTFKKNHKNTTTRTRKHFATCCRSQMLSARQRRNEHSAYRPVPDQKSRVLVGAGEAEAEVVTEVVAVVAAVVADEVTVVEGDAVAGAGDDIQY